MLDSRSNNKEKQVLWIEKEIQVIGAMPDQNCFDKILLHLMPAWCAGPSQNICVRSVSVLSPLAGLPLLSHPCLCYPHSPGCSNPQENAASAGHKTRCSSCKVNTALTLQSRQSRQASAAQNHHPHLQVTLSIAFKAPQT